jgi:hypothetical protein
VHVLDASRAVPVVAALLDAERRQDFAGTSLSLSLPLSDAHNGGADEVSDEYADMRLEHAAGRGAQEVPVALERARLRGLRLQHAGMHRPSFLGAQPVLLRASALSVSLSVSLSLSLSRC